MAQNSERRAAQRYRFDESSERDGRVASGYPRNRRVIRKAEIYDVSQTGIAFRINGNFAPQIGEIIAIEFKLPSGSRIAWYAQVIRVEMEYINAEQELPATPTLKVGAAFLETNPLQRKQLAKQVEYLLQKVQSNPPSRVRILSETLEVRRTYTSAPWNLLKAILIFAISAFMAFQFVSYLSQIGSPKLRTQGPPIVTDLSKTLPEYSPVSPSKSENK